MFKLTKCTILRKKKKGHSEFDGGKKSHKKLGQRQQKVSKWY